MIVALHGLAEHCVPDAGGMRSRQYRLVVEGELSDHVGLTLEGMTLTREGGNTVLVGNVRDQAELQGLLQRLADFGLTLLSATAVDEQFHRRGGA